MRFRFLALFALIVACGARTGLTDPDSRGGSSAEGGGAVGGGGSPSDGAGGEGGDLPVCATLVLDGPPRSHVDPIPASTRERDASLVAVDDTRVMLFHTLDDDLAEGSDLRAATFDAWGAWPDSLGPARHVMSAVREG
ncbi:MAG: hypothetical protein HOW73_16810, partial [Polyangiaceae bacterium]|nr:hypothetical protein [Polyangiaceae bacterium]